MTESKSVCKNYYYVHLSIHMSRNYSGQKHCIFHVGVKPLTIEHIVDSIGAREKQPNKNKKNEENISSCLIDCYSNYAGLGVYFCLLGPGHGDLYESLV